MILRRKRDEPTAVNVGTEKIKVYVRGREAEPYLLSPNPKTRYIEFHFSRGDDYLTIRPSRFGINRGGGTGSFHSMTIHE